MNYNVQIHFIDVIYKSVD